MKKKIFAILLSACVMVSQIVPACAADSNDAEYSGDEILVTFSDTVADKTVKKVIEGEDCDCEQISKVCEDVKIAQVEIPEDTSVEEAIDEFEDNSKVVSAQPNYRYEFYEKPAEPAVTDENSSNYQYQISLTNADKAWKLLEEDGYKAARTKVAVIDTGVDVEHEDLQEALTDEVKKDGYVGCVYNKKEKRFADSGSHGTHVSGIIGATYGNSLGGCGIASGTTNDLIDLTVISASDDGDGLYTFDIINALYEARDQGAEVINMSFGVAARDRITEKTIKEIHDAGIVMVAASGNEAYTGFVSPASFKEVISVNASDSRGKATYYTNYGRYSDILAPGHEVYSTVPGDRYNAMSGTSMASPVVTAICAMVLDANPSLTPAQVKNVICASTEKDFMKKKAFGLIDAEKSVQAAHDAMDGIEATGLGVQESDGVVTVEEGDYTYLEAVVRPANILYDDSLITWEIENPEIASMDQHGKLTGIKKGKTIVKAITGEISIPIFVEVTKNIEDVTSFEIKDREQLKKVEVGDDISLAAVTNSKNAEVYWDTDDEDVLFIDENGNTAECIVLGEGTATLTGMTKDVLEKKCEPVPGVNCDTITVTATKRTAYGKFVSQTDRLLAGEKYTFTMKPVAKDGSPTSGGVSIEYESTDPGVAEIDSETGEVKAKKAGVTYITGYVNYLPYELNFGGMTFEIPQALYGKTIRLEVGKAEYKAKDYGLKVSSVTSGSASIKWNKLKAVSSYKVYKLINGKYTEVKTLAGNGTSFKDSNVKPGKTYSYKVEASYSNKDTGLSKKFESSSAVKALTKPEKVEGVKAVSKKGTATVSWKKANGASGYYVYRATGAKGKFVKTAAVSGTKYTDKTVKQGKVYRYKVKAYAKASGKTAIGVQSASVKVKVK